MIINTIVYLIAFLLFLKFLWNIFTPYVVERGYVRHKISFATIIEILLLVFLCIFYFFSEKIIYNLSTLEIFIVGIILIAMSYFFAMLVGIFCRYFYK